MANGKIKSVQNQLGDISQEISFISLNAHIEASKATGEANRRFSVVSQEMTKVSRKLEDTLKELNRLFEEEENESM